MRMHYLQHVPFEGPSGVAAWAVEHGHTVSGTPLFADAALPELDEFDWLVIMGGPMSVHDVDEHPWLARERQFIADAIAAGKRVLGVCLGAQLIADALGAGVYRGEEREIGWHPVQLVPAGADHALCGGLDERFTAFHWHGETYELPSGATHLARSAAYEQQAFAVGERVLGLQFHIESTPDDIAKLIENCRDDLTGSVHVQSAEAMLSGAGRCREMRGLLDQVLTRLVGTR